MICILYDCRKGIQVLTDHVTSVYQLRLPGSFLPKSKDPGYEAGVKAGSTMITFVHLCPCGKIISII